MNVILPRALSGDITMNGTTHSFLANKVFEYGAMLHRWLDTQQSMTFMYIKEVELTYEITICSEQ